MSTPEFPNFFLVGAPKCGTTALYEFLSQHPELFLPEKKELLMFGSDLSYPSRLSEPEFLAHYEPRRGEARAGTAHTAYMQSRTAAAEMKARCPDADIIVMLRNPAEMLHSWHSELLYETVEDIASFEEALDAEPERRRGERIPRNALNNYVEALFYTDVAAFGEQLDRYIDAFGRSHVHVILQEDLLGDPAGTYRATLEFLRVDPAFEAGFATHNANKAVRSRTLQRLYFGTGAPGHRLARNLIPRRLRQRLLQANVRVAEREPLDPAVRERLQRVLADDVARLGETLGRDLSSWTAATSTPAGAPPPRAPTTGSA